VKCVDYPLFCEANNTENSFKDGNFLCAKGHVGALCFACDNYGVFWG
jgi:hypothetical protein